MSRGVAAGAVGLAAVLGVLTTYTALRPEFERQKAAQLGQEYHEQPGSEKVISEAIMSDLKEAGQQAKEETGGFGWGFRQMFWAKASNDASKPEPATDTAMKGKSTERKE